MTITGWLPVAIEIGALLTIALFYKQIRPRPKIAAFAMAITQIVALSSILHVMSFYVATFNYPLIDNRLSAIDRSLGFDWLVFFNFVKDHPSLDAMLNAAYLSGFVQVLTIVILLSLTGRFERLREFTRLYAITMFIVIACSAVIPAAGAWDAYGVAHMTSNFYLPDFIAARSGQMHTIDLMRPNGIVQFPSFHASLGLIFILAARGIRGWFPVAIILNSAMIVSALTHGGHYMTDVLVGLAIVPMVALVLMARDSTSDVMVPPTYTDALSRDSPSVPISTPDTLRLSAGQSLIVSRP